LGDVCEIMGLRFCCNLKNKEELLYAEDG